MLNFLTQQLQYTVLVNSARSTYTSKLFVAKALKHCIISKSVQRVQHSYFKVKQNNDKSLATSSQCNALLPPLAFIYDI